MPKLGLNWQDCTKTDHEKIPLFSSRLLQISDSFHLKASFKFFLVLFETGNKVHVNLLRCRLFCSSAMFYKARSKVQIILCPKVWSIFCTRLSSRRIFQFSVVFLRWKSYEFAPARGSPDNVKDHVVTSQDYSKLEHLKTLLLRLTLAKVPTVSILLLISFVLHFQILLVEAIVFLSSTMLPGVANFKWEDENFPGIGSIMTKKMVTGFFQV